MTRSSRWGAVLLYLSTHTLPSLAHGQWQTNTGPAGATMGAVVGSDVERYTRALSIAGIVPPLPWVARPFAPDDLQGFLRDTSTLNHPWRTSMRRASARRIAIGGAVFASANSGFPWGDNDGALWQGRGVTGAAGAVATLRWGRLTAIAAPVVFSAQNMSFPLLPQVQGGVSPFAEALFPGAIDAPQRMGANSYSRLDAGESTLRIQGLGLVTGISTASQGWGTGEAFPAILGPNAGGFPHIFLGTTGRGLRVPYVGHVNGRYLLGTLSQSNWSPVSGGETYVDKVQSGTRRVAVGLSMSLTPSLLPNLEVGVSRFYHSPNIDGRDKWDAWSKPIEGLLKKGFGDRSTGAGDIGGGLDNQLASLFARWTLPGRGVEATFEYLRDDYSWDSRDFAQEPDNNGAVMASVRAVTERTAERLSILTFEFFNGGISPIAQARPQNFLYANTVMRQGHTLRGQVLGTPVGVGSMTGHRASWERFSPGGSWRANLQRWRTRSRSSTDPELLFRPPDAPLPNNNDWVLDGSLARTKYRTEAAFTVETGLAWSGSWHFGSSRTNLYVRASATIF